jgi:hypothetical protein|tara:strand:+ start:426 stop:1298 length:873 start_codon:yes stop_codon:yes gene_type:complete
MRLALLLLGMMSVSSTIYAQTTQPGNRYQSSPTQYDSNSYVINSTNTNSYVESNTNNTNSTTIDSSTNNVNINTNTSESTSTSNNTNINQNTNISQTSSSSENINTNTNTNTNVNTSTSSSTNTNNNTSNVTSNSTNVSNSTNNNTNTNENNTNITQQTKSKVQSPPPSAIAPTMMSYSQDLCVTGVSGAVQTQIIGLSGGKMVRDENCERLKLSKAMYDMGMKVAAVSVLCQDVRVFQAMEMAGTPCPYKGKIGNEAQVAWTENEEERPDYNKRKKKCRNDKKNKKVCR